MNKHEKERHKKIYDGKLANQFIDFCGKGNLIAIKEFEKIFQTKASQEMDFSFIKYGFFSALNSNQIEVAKYLADTQNYRQYLDLEKRSLKMILDTAITNERVKVIEYLLSSPKMLNKPTIQDKKEIINSSFLLACNQGKFSSIKFLLTSEDIPEKANPFSYGNQCVNTILKNGNLIILKYFLSVPAIREKLDISKIEKRDCASHIWKFLKKYKEIAREVENLKIISQNVSFENKVKLL